ncbi:uncharacterized protein LOC142079974 [Calonectris borealis]|uniref:uncharacterized protein LOC142079974 n=1 Tax=Calonectris borealis TaxID=1323832 RepID=UPI003F4B471A
MAGRRQVMPKMPMDEEAKEHAQPAHGLPSLQKRRQVGRRQLQAAPQGSQSRASSLHGDRLPRLPCPESSQTAGSRRAQTDSLAHRVALPCSRVTTREETARLPALPPLPRQAAAPAHAPAAWPPGAARTCGKLVFVPAPPPASSARGRERTISTAASGHRQLVPSAGGIRGDQGTALRVKRWTPAPHKPAACAAAVKDTARCLVSEALDKVLTGSRGPSQQPTAQRDRAQGKAVVMRARINEAKAPASPAFSEQATAARAESHAPAPHSPTASAAALEDAARCIVAEALGRVSTGSRAASQRPVAQRDVALSRCWQVPGRHLPVGARLP